MSSEEQIEEILYEAHAYGVRNEVITLAKKLMETKRLSQVDAYQQSLQTLTVDS
tara:strand:- start:178 stop:339 length:162 start_codon:yes stop_codon:yes gene_type:complete